MYEWSTIHEQIFNKKMCYFFFLFDKDINLYQLQFSSSHFSFQPNK